MLSQGKVAFISAWIILLIQEIISQTSQAIQAPGAVTHGVQCPISTVAVLKEDKSEYDCKPCPTNCFACSWENNAAMCFGCNPGFFVDDQQACTACAAGCEYCSGPGMEKCFQLKQGYFFKPGETNLAQCAKGCALCDANGNCAACLPKFSSKVLTDSSNNKIKVGDSFLVTCTSCTDPNCDRCEIDVYEKEVCTACLNGFGPTGDPKVCKACETGCAGCQTGQGVCNYCKEGYQLDYGLGRCVLIPDTSNCAMMDLAKNICVSCNSGFTIDPLNQKMCVSCNPASPLCSTCYFDITKPDIPPNDPNRLVCTQCALGFILNSTTNKCEECPAGCLYCDAGKKCSLCKNGLFMDPNGACVKNSLAGCETQESSTKCLSCKSGFYLETKTDSVICQPCNAACLNCNGPGADTCTTCAVNKVFLLPPPDPIGQDPSYEKQFTKTCFDKCPPKDNLDITLIEDTFTRECKRNDDSGRLRPKYYFVRTFENVSWNTIYFDSINFIVTLKNYMEKIQSLSQDWAQEKPDEAKKFSKVCGYRGTLQERVSADRETYYECWCVQGYYGYNCLVDRELRESASKFIQGMVTDMEKFKTSINYPILFQIVRNLNHGSMTRAAVSTLVNFTLDIPRSTDYKTPATKEFYVAIDYMMRNIYRQKSEIENGYENKKMDISIFGVYQKSVNDMFQKLIDLCQKVSVSSLYTTDEPFNGTSTSAFQASFAVSKVSEFTKDNPARLFLPPTDMLGLGNNNQGVEVAISGRILAENAKSLQIHGWLFSNLMFIKFSDQGYFASPVVSFTIVKTSDKKIFSEGAGSFEDDYLEITFPLKTLPSEVDISNKMRCLRLKFIENSVSYNIDMQEVYKAGILPFNRRLYAKCRYPKFIIGTYFYSVGWQDNSKDAAPAELYRYAMDDGVSDKPIREYKEPPVVEDGLASLIYAQLAALAVIILHLLI
jgi:hypothetical protein